MPFPGGPQSPMPPFPMPGVMGPGPIPGVSGPAAPPPDQLTELARLIGETDADESVSAMEDMTEALNKLQSAARKDGRLSSIVQEMMAVLNKTQAPPGQGMGGVGGGLVNGPLPLPQGGMPPGMFG